MEHLPPDSGMPLPAFPQDCHGDAGLDSPGTAQGPAKARNEGKQGRRDAINDIRTADDTRPKETRYRKEYWSFFLVNIFLSIIPFVGTIYSLAVLIPSLAVAVRRMHDVGVSGWYILIPIYNIVLLCTKGDHFYNEYGGPTV